MRIAIDIRCLDTPERTGIGEYTSSLLSRLSADNFSKHQFCLFHNSFHHTTTPEYNNFSHFTGKIPNKLFNFLQLTIGFPKLDNLVKKKFQPDIFFSPNLNFTSISTKTKHVLMVHDISFILFPKYYTLKQRYWHRLANLPKQLRNSSHIIVPSEHTKNDIVNNFNISPKKITVIYPGVPDFLNLDNSKKNSQFNNYILSVGTLEPRKNTLNIIRAFEYAFNKTPRNYSLVIAGGAGSDSKNVLDKIDRSPIKNYIHYLGYTSPEEKKSLYQNASLLVYPSFYEGFGFPVLEAMSVGVPVITSNRSSLPEVGGNAVYYINPQHPEEITEGIVRLLNQPKLSEDLKQKGLARAKTFSWEKTALDWLRVMEKI